MAAVAYRYHNAMMLLYFNEIYLLKYYNSVPDANFHHKFGANNNNIYQILSSVETFKKPHYQTVYTPVGAV